MCKWISSLLFFFVVTQTSIVFATTLSKLDQFNYDKYFVISENSKTSKDDFSLLLFSVVNKSFPLPSVPYKRVDQFGTWIHDEAGSCLNTRGHVLVRESKVNVTFKPSGCTVESGQWDDEYTAQKIDSADLIQIDHLVPLKNAYMTGAFEWDYNKRCLYANFMGNNFHLLAVSGKENMKKGDRDPHGYMPPNQDYSCEYIKHWLQVKFIWSLRLTPDEVSYIQKATTQAHCDLTQFQMSRSELNDQRRYMQDHADICGTH